MPSPPLAKIHVMLACHRSVPLSPTPPAARFWHLVFGPGIQLSESDPGQSGDKAPPGSPVRAGHGTCHGDRNNSCVDLGRVERSPALSANPLWRGVQKWAGHGSWRVMAACGRWLGDGCFHGRPPGTKNPFRISGRGRPREVGHFLISRDLSIPLDLAPFPRGDGCCDVIGPVPRSLWIRRVDDR